MTSGAGLLWRQSQAWSPDSRDQRVCEAARSTECGSPNPAAGAALGGPQLAAERLLDDEPPTHLTPASHAPSGTQEAEYHVSQEGGCC